MRPVPGIPDSNDHRDGRAGGDGDADVSDQRCGGERRRSGRPIGAAAADDVSRREHASPDRARNERHVGHEREREAEEYGTEQQGRGCGHGDQTIGAKRPHQRVDADARQPREDQRRHAQSRKRESRRQTEERAPQQLCGERYGRPVGELETMFRDERTHGMSVRPVVEDRKVSRWIDDEDGGEPDQEERRNGEIRHGMTVDRSHRCARKASCRRGGRRVPSLAARFRSTCRGRRMPGTVVLMA